jgi:NADPH:quinone reductase-like Zn-dependent oxidoreductase
VPVAPPKGREILVKVAACAVAFRDILDRKGAFPFIKKPTILGHEFAGVVAALGPDAREFQIGQRVVSLHWAQRDAWPSPLQVICASFSFQLPRNLSFKSDACETG